MDTATSGRHFLDICFQERLTYGFYERGAVQTTTIYPGGLFPCMFKREPWWWLDDVSVFWWTFVSRKTWHLSHVGCKIGDLHFLGEPLCFTTCHPFRNTFWRKHVIYLQIFNFIFVAARLTLGTFTACFLFLGSRFNFWVPGFLNFSPQDTSTQVK